MKGLPLYIVFSALILKGAAQINLQPQNYFFFSQTYNTEPSENFTQLRKHEIFQVRDLAFLSLTNNSVKSFENENRLLPKLKLLSSYDGGIKKRLFFPPGNTSFTLENKSNPKQKLILQKTKVTLFIDESSAGTAGQMFRYNTTECYLDSLKGDSITVSPVTEEIDIDSRNKYSSITNTYFGSSFTKVQKTIPLKNIVYLQTRNPFRSVLSKSATVLMSAAIVLIVGSPFAGYKQNADARIQARENAFMAGMICFGTAVPLFVAARPKKYAISENYLSRKNKYWRIIQNH